MLKREDIINLYVTLLDREPESEETISNYIRNFSSIYEAIRVIINSEEYKLKMIDKLMSTNLIPETVILFTHIPKTAGTYLRTGWLINNINSYFWTDEKREHPTLNDLKNSVDIASKYGLIGGHKPMDDFVNVKTVQNRVFISVLRDPIERIISFYNHVKYNDKNHPFHKEAKNKTLYKLLIEKKDFYNTIKDEQIKYIVVNKNNMEHFEVNDKLIIGTQKKIDLFIDKVNNICNLKNKNVVKEVVQSNKGVENYKNSIVEEEDYEKAKTILEELTKKEYDFIKDIGEIAVFDKKDYKKLCQKYASFL